MPFIIRVLIISIVMAGVLLSFQCNKRVSTQGSVLEKVEPGKGHSMNLPPIYFNYYKTFLTPEAMSRLFEIGSLLKTNENYTLIIEGHSDDDVEGPYEKWLVNERAKVVYDWLVRYGTFTIEEKRVVIKNSGNDRAAIEACGSDQNCHEKNRRVDLTVIVQ